MGVQIDRTRKPHINRSATGTSATIRPGVNGPRGPKGDPGVGADNATIAGYVTTPGATQDALAADYAARGNFDSVNLGVPDFVGGAGTPPAITTNSAKTYVYWSFPNTGSNEGIVLSRRLILPEHWQTFAVDVTMVNDSAQAGGFTMRCDTAMVGPGDNINSPYAIGGNVSVTMPAQHVLGTFTLLSSVAAGAVGKGVMMRVYRNGAGSTFAAAAGLVAVTLRRVS